jgi:protein N-terminal methyltransferase
VDLVSFLQRCKAALREGGRSLIVVKENLCRDFGEDFGAKLGPRTVFDEQDSSLTRYVPAAFKSH